MPERQARGGHERPDTEAQVVQPQRGIEGEPLTWEGQFRLMGRLGTGASSLPRWLRWTLTGVLVACAVTWVVVLIIGFVRLGL